MTRQEHLVWCKSRALEYVDMNDLRGAINSMMSDLYKHDETRNSAIICMMGMNETTQYGMRKFINGFN